MYVLPIDGTYVVVVEVGELLGGDGTRLSAVVLPAVLEPNLVAC